MAGEAGDNNVGGWVEQSKTVLPRQAKQMRVATSYFKSPLSIPHSHYRHLGLESP